MTTVDPCKQLACKLQKCLKDNVYQPSRCQEILEEIRKCCIKHSSISTVCDGIDTSKRYEHNTVDYFLCVYSSANLFMIFFLLNHQYKK
ncbi:hypothetical protein ACFW04_004931 [Cataglyphis niger]